MHTQTQKQFYPTIKQSFGLIVILIVVSIPIFIPLMGIGYLLKNYLNLNSDLTNSAVTLIGYLVLFVIVSRSALKKYRLVNNTGYRLKFNKIPIAILLISVITAFAAIFVIDPFIALVPMPEPIQEFFAEVNKPNIFSFLNIVIAAPILEEILFRGIILEGFLKNYSPKKAIIWSALIFGIMHLNPWQAIPAAIGGLIIGWLYWKSKSLIPGIVIHWANNLASFLIMGLSNNETDTFVSLINNGFIFSLLLASAFLILLIGYKVLDKKFDSSVQRTDSKDSLKRSFES